MSRFLIIQTAFLGDVILATAVVEKLAAANPKAQIDFLLRKGNEGLLKNNPHIGKVFIWDKDKAKIFNLLTIISDLRHVGYDTVINLHRFGSSGFVTAFSGAKSKIGFDKNPWSFTYTTKVQHSLDNIHETERNHNLIVAITDGKAGKPRLYPSSDDVKAVGKYQREPYSCIAPSSVWFTKQYPAEKWLELIERLQTKVYLLGGPDDKKSCDAIRDKSSGNVEVLAGDLSFLQTAALMKDAQMNYVNDSAPLHIASAMDAPVTAIYCSTVPEFGFGPLASNSKVVQTKENLSCRPCGIHGLRTCPEGHFKCAKTISIDDIVS